MRSAGKSWYRNVAMRSARSRETEAAVMCRRSFCRRVRPRYPGGRKRSSRGGPNLRCLHRSTLTRWTRRTSLKRMTGTIRTKRWCRVEYERLIDLGIFRGDDRLELLGGNLLVREPQSDRHALAIELCHDALRAAFGAGWRIRVQLPVALDDESEPEPDVSVI